MTQRILPLQIRIAILLRSRSGPLCILALATAATAALGLRSGSLEGAATGLLVVVGVPLVLTTVGADLRNRVVLLWVQKPVNPVQFYLARFLEGALASVSLSLLIIGVSIGVLLHTGWEPAVHPLRAVVAFALVAFVVASMGFGFCVTIPRGGRLATVALLGVTLAREALVGPDPSAVDWHSSLPVRMLLFPIAALADLATAEGMAPELLLGHLARVFCYAAAWIGIGALGIHRAFSRGTWARSV